MQPRPTGRSRGKPGGMISDRAIRFMLQAEPCAGARSGSGGAEEDRTPDLRIANATLSQLSYGPGACSFARQSYSGIALIAILPAAGTG